MALVSASPCVQGVEFYGDEYMEWDLAEAKRIRDELGKAIAEVEDRGEAPGPGPLYINDNHELIPGYKNNSVLPKEITCLAMLGPRVDQVEKYGIDATILGYEMQITEIIILRDWIEHMISYYRDYGKIDINEVIAREKDERSKKNDQPTT